MVSLPFRLPKWHHVLLGSAICIPLLTSSLGGLSHRVSCRSEWTSDFEIDADGSTDPLVSSAVVLTRDSPAEPAKCPGFRLDLQVNPNGPSKLRNHVIALNESTSAADATLALTVNGDTSYVRLGSIGSGQSIERDVIVNVPKGSSTLKARVLLGG